MKSLISLLTFYFFCLFFFLWPHLRHIEVPGPGVESELQLRSTMPQPWQHGIQAASATYATACSNAGSLATEYKARDRTCILLDTNWVLNLLSHNGNAVLFFFVVSDHLFFLTDIQVLPHVLEIENLPGGAMLSILLKFNIGVPAVVQWDQWCLGSTGS